MKGTWRIRGLGKLITFPNELENKRACGLLTGKEDLVYRVLFQIKPSGCHSLIQTSSQNQEQAWSPYGSRLIFVSINIHNSFKRNLKKRQCGVFTDVYIFGVLHNRPTMSFNFFFSATDFIAITNLPGIIDGLFIK